MKDLLGSPGKVSGLILRIAQCLFASASAVVMVSASGFSRTTAFCFLVAAMGLQTLWSFLLLCIDIHALRVKRDLQNHILVSLFAVGDWVTAILSLAAACSSGGVVIVFSKDTNLCHAGLHLACSMFQIAVGLAFVSWFLLALSSGILFWLVASST
ncbi:CASP-like protein 5B1 [Impatiens glandulifera]|uniref:CASP-like protein 5B1 n=1 Tax=Impatiens glandulifera TaxID=253017 RepID=UPI001FB0BC08|nr:CASP-like protein 5B1 [Impatiens glandulifera]